VQVVFDNIPSSYPLIQAQRIRPLAVAAKQRLKVLPDVPTYAEAGLPAMNNPSWFGLAAPAGTQAAVLDKLNAAVRETLQDPATAEAIEKQGAVPSPMPRAEFGALIAQSYGHWKTVVEDIKFQKMQ
jgi:tripartite-type tricarboxylate transporter receptor subunit TctC